MFSNVGGEIKAWAVVIVVLCTIGGFILGLLSGFLLAVILGVVGFIIGRLMAMTLYAFGQLTEDNQQMNYKMEKINKMADDIAAIKKSLQNSGSQGAASGQCASGQWRCSCGRINESYVSTCTCGASKPYAQTSAQN